MLSKLIKSNFKNDLSHMVTFFLIMVLAVFMLHTGLAIFNGYSTLHAEKREEHGFADLMIYSVFKTSDKEKVEDIISKSDIIESYEKYFPIIKTFEKTKAGSDVDSKNIYDSSSNNLLVLPYGEWGEIEAPHFIELSEEKYDNPIYLSVFINTNLVKAKLGDSVDMKVGDKYYTFQVAGIYESLLSSEVGVTYVDPSLYNEWKLEEDNENIARAQAANDSEEADGSIEDATYIRTLIYLKTVEGVNQTDATGQLSQVFKEKEVPAFAMNSDNVINDFTYMQNMIAAMIAAFSIIITIIAMIIIYFRISNSIEQNIVNIGALKSLGYTSRQIRLSMVIEFSLTTFIALIAGVVSSYLILPVFEEYMRTFSGAKWDVTFDIASFLITLIVILGTVILVSFSSTKLIKKLDPVIALRFGIDTHSFKKNHAPIEKTPGPLTWIMAVKSLLTSTKQNLILLVVSLSISLVTTFAVFLSYNCVYDPSYLLRMLNLVAPDVDLQFDKNEFAVSEIAELPEVESVYWLDTTEMMAEGYNVYAMITEDWKDISEVNLYEGRCPKYDNEVAIGGNLSETLGIGTGDEIKITNGLIEREFLVTGIEQSTANYGNIISMTEEGSKHLNYEASKASVGVFVKNHSLENSIKLVDDVLSMYGDKISGYGNAIETLHNGDEVVISIAASMVAAMVLVSIVVIFLSLNLLVKTMLIKKQKEIGIKKALGFSSEQLRIELLLSMLPQIGVGALIGAYLGSISSNNMMATLLSSMGIMRSNMEMFPWMGMVSILFILIVSSALIWLISGRIKHISAYSLITE